MEIAARDVGQAGIAAIALLAVALLLLPADAEAGQCSRPERVNHRDAECLSASWKNRGLLKKSPYSVSNQCSEYGKVVAKVDLVSAGDRTLHLTDSHPRDGDTRHRIRGIYCCSDLSTLCNRSDVESDAGCLKLFERESTAAATCASATATYSSENGTCTISAECRPRDAPGQDMYASRTRVTVPATDVDEVHNCNGWLHSEACDFRPLTMSVSDAQVREARGATLDFVVSLNRTHWQKVRVLYWTSDGTAQRERDYLPRFGYLHFAPGQAEKKVSVRVLDDELDEGNETMWLSLSYASHWVSLVDPAAMGTIVNTDPMPRAWIGRFGRTVAEQVLDAVDARMRAEPAPGAEARLGGQPIVAEPAMPGFEEHSPLLAQGRSATGRDLLQGTSFALTGEAQGDGVLSIWGRGAVTRFDGRDGDLAVDGEVATGLFGAD